MNEINPWESTTIDDYQKLFDEFGISRFDELLPRIKDPHRFMRRGIIFGHRSYDSIVDAINSKKPFSAMSGFMPSGRIHLGHKMVMEEIIWHQQQGGTVFMAVADMEAHSVRGISWEECRRIGVEEYILSLIALGFEPEGGRIYSQSTSPEVRDLAFELGVKANFSELSAIYGFNGETNIAHMVSATMQSADILHPQLKEFGGPRPVVIPVGADQDPHIRLTRGLADKMNMFHVFQTYTVRLYCKSATQDVFNNLIEILSNNFKIYELDENNEYVDLKEDFNQIKKFVDNFEHFELYEIDDIIRIDRKSASDYDFNNLKERLGNNIDEKFKIYELDEEDKFIDLKGDFAYLQKVIKEFEHSLNVNMFDVSQKDKMVKIYSKSAPKEAFKTLKKRLSVDFSENDIRLFEGHIDVNGDIQHVREAVKDVELLVGGYAFLPPASTYHKFMTGLQGGKMSSSIPDSIIALTEEPKAAAKKIMRAKTGGRVTLEEQKKHGGVPDECTVYELMLYHLVEDDNEVLGIRKECMSGDLMCGTCKKRAAGLMEKFLTEHQKRREAARERLPEFGIDHKF
jgi:tryptophanyl-tRNA synthetase